MIRALIKFVCFFSVLLICSAISPAVTHAVSDLYVNPQTGNDASAGSNTAPFKTIAKALSIVQPGTTIHLLGTGTTEKISINGKKGTLPGPITIVGESMNASQYFTFDGGDPNYSQTSDSSPIVIKNSSYIVIERVNIVNATKSGIVLDGSSYIVVRRNKIVFNQYGVKLQNKSHHILMEYNELSQPYGRSKKWSEIKGSKWEGGAYTSFGGMGMNIIRYNYIHDAFNGIYQGRGDRVGNYYDANTWIFFNRFEYILDDPFEPESYSFNNHFSFNALINTHRIVSAANGASLLPTPNLGPIYVYNNVQLNTVDVTNEGDAHPNGSIKLDLEPNFFKNGLYVFNNSIDLSRIGNGIVLDSVGSKSLNKFLFANNAVIAPTLSDSFTSTATSDVDYNVYSSKLVWLTEPHGLSNTDPGFVNPAAEDFRLKSNSASIGRARELSQLVGFSKPTVVAAGTDVGAYQHGSDYFHTYPSPKYVVPEGGEDPSFGASNDSWPADTRGGVNPPYGLNGSSQPTATALPTPTVTPTNPGVTVSPSNACPLQADGDANCDGKINLNDFERFRQEFTGILTTNTSDFSGDGKVTLIDFEEWRRNFQ